MRRADGLRHRGERADRQHFPTPCRSWAAASPLGDTAGNAQAGERTGAGREGDGIEVGKACTRLGQQRCRERQQGRRRRLPRRAMVLAQDAVAPEGDGTGIGGGFEGEELHAGILPCRAPDYPTELAFAGTDAARLRPDRKTPLPVSFDACVGTVGTDLRQPRLSCRTASGASLRVPRSWR